MQVSKSKLRENYKSRRVIEMSKFSFSFLSLFWKKKFRVNISLNNNKKKLQIPKLIPITYC